MVFSSSYLNQMFYFYSPRDSSGGLGVKMVEYVLGGSPTNKECPLDSRLRNLKIDEVKVTKNIFNNINLS